MDHQVENLPSLGLKLKSLCFCSHARSVPRRVQTFKTGWRVAAAHCVLSTSLRGRQLSWWKSSGGSASVACLPAFEVLAKNEKFAPDLDDTNTLFLYDSTEVPH